MGKEKFSKFTHKPHDKRCAHLSNKALNGLEDITLPHDSHPNHLRALKQTHTTRALGFGPQTWGLCTVAVHTHLLKLCSWRSFFSTRLQHREWRQSHWYCSVLISSAWWQLTQRRDKEAGTKHLHDVAASRGSSVHHAHTHANAHIQKHTDTFSHTELPHSRVGP